MYFTFNITSIVFVWKKKEWLKDILVNYHFKYLIDTENLTQVYNLYIKATWKVTFEINDEGMVKVEMWFSHNKIKNNTNL